MTAMTAQTAPPSRALLLLALAAFGTLPAVVPAKGYHDGSLRLHTWNVELVGHNGEVARVGKGITELQVRGPYVYLGSLGGVLLVVNVSDPANPQLVGKLAFEGGDIRDVKLHPTREIAVITLRVGEPPDRGFRIQFPGVFDLRLGGETPGEEEGEGEGEGEEEEPAGDFFRGIVVVDLSDPRNPRELARLPNVDDRGEPSEVHNLYVDGDYAYLVGTGRGLVVVSLQDPENPREVAVFRGSGMYYHDVVVKNLPNGRRIAYLCGIFTGLHLVDVTVPEAPVELGVWREPGWLQALTHYAEPTPSGRITVVGPEHGSGYAGRLYLVDTRDPNRPRLLSTWSLPGHEWQPSGFPPQRFQYQWTLHNFDVREDRVYLAHYGAGVWVIDISDPQSPRAIASFGPESFRPSALVPDPEHEGQEGFPVPRVWAVEEQDGLLYASDISSGLYVLRVKEGIESPGSLERSLGPSGWRAAPVFASDPEGGLYGLQGELLGRWKVRARVALTPSLSLRYGIGALYALRESTRVGGSWRHWPSTPVPGFAGETGGRLVWREEGERTKLLASLFVGELWGWAGQGEANSPERSPAGYLHGGVSRFLKLTPWESFSVQLDGLYGRLLVLGESPRDFFVGRLSILYRWKGLHLRATVGRRWEVAPVEELRFGLGGFDSEVPVRGYPRRALEGDGLLALSAEWRFPSPIKPSPYSPALEAFVFVDVGVALPAGAGIGLLNEAKWLRSHGFGIVLSNLGDRVGEELSVVVAFNDQGQPSLQLLRRTLF